MWASLLSGGHATYGGACTYEPFNGREKGVRGYFDLKKEGILSGGADDFIRIHQFFREAGVTLVGLRPADAIAGNDPAAAKVMAGERTMIVYLQNPDSRVAEKADAADAPAHCRLDLPRGDWRARWFDPREGQWREDPSGNTASAKGAHEFKAPFTGDAVLLFTRNFK